MREAARLIAGYHHLIGGLRLCTARKGTVQYGVTVQFIWRRRPVHLTPLSSLFGFECPIAWRFVISRTHGRIPMVLLPCAFP